MEILKKIYNFMIQKNLHQDFFDAVNSYTQSEIK